MEKVERVRAQGPDRPELTGGTTQAEYVANDTAM